MILFKNNNLKNHNKYDYRRELILVLIITYTWILFIICFILFFLLQPREVFNQYEFESFLIVKSFGVFWLVSLIYLSSRIKKKQSKEYNQNEAKFKSDTENHIKEISVDEMIEEMKEYLECDSNQFDPQQNNYHNLILEKIINDIDKKIKIILAEINDTIDPLKLGQFNEAIAKLNNLRDTVSNTLKTID